MTETIEYVVTKRQSNFDYIKRVHQGKVHWLNVIQIDKSSILKYYSPIKLHKRVERWFLLGLSAGKLLDFPNGSLVVRALAQLLEEYEHYTNSTGSLFAAKEKETKSKLSHVNMYLSPTAHTAPHTSSVLSRFILANINNSTEPVKPQLSKIGKQVVYEFLQTPHISSAGSLDYCEVVYSLCDVLSLVYSKFLDQSCAVAVIHEAILKIDRKIMQMVISKISGDLTAIATPLLKLELKSLLNHMFIDDTRTTPQAKKYIQLSEKKPTTGDPNTEDAQHKK